MKEKKQERYYPSMSKALIVNEIFMYFYEDWREQKE